MGAFTPEQNAELQTLATGIVKQVTEALGNHAKSIQITMDERVNETKAHVDAELKKGLEKSGTPNNANSPLYAPHVQKFINGQGAGPLSVGDGIVDPPVGKAFITSDAYKDYAEKAGMAKRVGGKAPSIGSSGKVMIGNFFGARGKTSGVTATTDIQAVLSTELAKDIIVLPEREIRTRDLLRVVPTKVQVGKYVRQTGFTNNAGAMPLNQTDPQTATAAAQSELTYSEESWTAAKLAHYIPVSADQLADTESLEAAIEIQGKLGVLLIEDVWILSGTGANGQPLGILNDPAVPATMAWSAMDAGDNMADLILQAIVAAFIANYPVDGNVLHPTDWMRIVKAKDTMQRYLLPDGFRADMIGNPAQPSVKTLKIWGLNTVRTTAIAQGYGLTGAWDSTAVMHDLQEAEMRIFDQHADWAIKGLLAMYFWEKFGLEFNRPEAFRPFHFDAAPAT